jgi:hypothetical protein
MLDDTWLQLIEVYCNSSVPNDKESVPQLPVLVVDEY